MIAALLAEIVWAFSNVAIVAADDGPPTWLLVAGPVGGGGAYFGLWRYYRNTHQSHSFEHETRVEAQSITSNDAKFDEVKGTKRSKVDGDNRSNHRKRVTRLP